MISNTSFLLRFARSKKRKKERKEKKVSNGGGKSEWVTREKGYERRRPQKRWEKRLGSHCSFFLHVAFVPSRAKMLSGSANLSNLIAWLGRFLFIRFRALEKTKRLERFVRQQTGNASKLTHDDGGVFRPLQKWGDEGICNGRYGREQIWGDKLSDKSLLISQSLLRWKVQHLFWHGNSFLSPDVKKGVAIAANDPKVN